MTIHIVGNDADVYGLCRDILAEHPGWGRSSTLVPAPPEEPREGDLYIWDFHAALRFPEWLGATSSQHLFLVARNDLDAFRERTQGMEGSVLLKPVGRATLTTFLTTAIPNATAKSLRADRDQMLQCLIQANLKLQQYDQERTTFLARAVHDFRAPLTALGGYCGLLLSGALGALSDGQRDVLERMEQSVKRLSRIASTMFQLSAGRHVVRRPDLQAADMRECVEQALYETAPFANEKSIIISYELDPWGDGLFFEAGQIEQVLINILDNACKFLPKGGSIDVRGYPFFWERRRVRSPLPAGFERRERESFEPNSYRIDIRDAGVPIPPEHLGLIFEEYTSYSGGCDRSGGGLGLAICKLILSQHEGMIWAENTDLGPRFSFVLPLRSPECVQNAATGAAVAQEITIPRSY